LRVYLLPVNWLIGDVINGLNVAGFKLSSSWAFVIQTVKFDEVVYTISPPTDEHSIPMIVTNATEAAD
jgi:hypothetical protein